MLNKLFFASLLALSSSTATLATADRAPARPAAPRPTGCLLTEEATTQLFQIENKSNGEIKDAIETRLTIQSNGAWRYEATRSGKVVRTEVGCLSGPELALIKTRLAAATWKTSHAEMRCLAVAFDHLEYSYNGKLVLRTEMCDGLILDPSTRKALADVTAITSKLVK